MKSTPRSITEALAGLERTPQVLARVASSQTAVQLSFAPDPKTWSAQDVLAHLRACADLWTHSIYAMLADKDPILPDINERKYARAAGFQAVPFLNALEVFRLQRANLLSVLGALEPGEWECGALILGRRHTVFTQSRRMAKHEAEHCAQIEKLLE